MTQPQANQFIKVQLELAVKTVQVQVSDNHYTDALLTIAHYIVYHKPNHLPTFHKDNAIEILNALKALTILYSYLGHISQELKVVRETLALDLLLLLTPEEKEAFKNALSM